MVKREMIKRFLPYLFWIFPIVMVLSLYLFIFKDLPSPTKLGVYNVPLATKVYDRNGTLLYDIFADQNRTVVPLSKIPKNLQHATLSIEDKDFYKHAGINPIGGIVRALFASITRQSLQGGSTITQQLVKSALLTSERTITRKIKEVILSYWVESLYSKDKILEMYLNQVPYGGTAWGVESAAEKYFGKHVEDLTLAETALLAGLPQAPSLYSPFGNHPEYAIERQSQVIKRMVEDGYITVKQEEGAKATPIVYKRTENIKAPHFVMYVKELLSEKYGERMVEQGGLTVKTTLDFPLQEFTQHTVASEVAKLKPFHVGNGAALITKPATGEILAMVGSRDYFASPSGTYNVVTALRQPGSSIKPINYGIALDRHLITAATMLLDVPTCFDIPTQPNYCPKNYDGKFHGPMQVRLSLGNSLNIPAVKVMYVNTVSDFVASASAFGLSTLKNPDDYGLSLTLGGGEVHMTDMAEAFGVFANAGIRKDLTPILKVMDKNGKILEEFKDPNLDRDIPSQLQIRGKRALSAESAFLISHILSDNNARQDAFGPDSLLKITDHAVSVKTGTTDDLRDNWTIGFTPLALVATWVGNNDSSPMNPSLVSGVTGAAPIWNKLIRKVLEKKPDILPKRPDGIEGAQICQTSGLLPPNPEGNTPAEKGCETRFEYFIKGTVPNEREKIKDLVHIDKATGELALPNQIDNIDLVERHVLRDPISAYCSDCTNAPGHITFIPIR
ncbi:transglycosylase domain-containing protein [Candidatus Gottesmanbacteria bacterium]|nr:transglycosylase domain-containing protein [Candidatus Gottesmanbacteria bacterium]